MCLYPKLIKNPRYKPNKKNGGIVPDCYDERMEYVPIGCGNCIECRQQKAREWQVRLAEELKVNNYAYFTTLTFSEESLTHFLKTYNIGEYNAIAGKAVRLFLERWRKKYKKTLRHWLITELGHTGTERIHLHGIIFSDFEISNELLNNIWKYGYSDIGQYCNLQSINYIIKYVTKIDQDHKTYKPIILNSPGIGKSFCEKQFTKELYKYKPKKSPEFYTLADGTKINLPIYYRNKLYDEQTRMQLWSERLDQNRRYVRGIRIDRIDTEEGRQKYYNILAEAQSENKKLGYGDRSEEWKQEPYNITLKQINARTHEKNAHAREKLVTVGRSDAPAARFSETNEIKNLTFKYANYYNFISKMKARQIRSALQTQPKYDKMLLPYTKC